MTLVSSKSDSIVFRPPDGKRKRKMRGRQKVVAVTTGFVMRRRHGGGHAFPDALPEAPSTALLSSLFSIRQPYYDNTMTTPAEMFSQEARSRDDNKKECLAVA